jgi:hypothetical protein
MVLGLEKATLGHWGVEYENDHRPPRRTEHEKTKQRTTQFAREFPPFSIALAMGDGYRTISAAEEVSEEIESPSGRSA